VAVNRCFGGTYHLHLPGWRETNMKLATSRVQHAAFLLLWNISHPLYSMTPLTVRRTLDLVTGLQETIHTVTYLGVRDYRRGMDYWMSLLTTSIHHSELHSTDHWHTQTSTYSLLQSPLIVSWQRLLPREILQLPAIRFSCHGRPSRILVKCQLN
jgi:hypothetical protein